MKQEAKRALLNTDLLLLEPPCQNYSGKNRSTHENRFSDTHSNIAALWSSLELWTKILPVGLNIENVEGMNHFKTNNGPLLGRVLGKVREL